MSQPQFMIDLEKAVQAVPDSFFKANLLNALGAEYNKTSDELFHLTAPYFYRKIEDIQGDKHKRN